MKGFSDKYWVWYKLKKKIITSHILGWICFDGGTLRLSQISYLWEFLGQLARFWVSRSSTGHICSSLIGTVQLWIPGSIWYWTPCYGLSDPTHTSTVLYLSCRPCSWMLSCGWPALIWTLVHITRSRILCPHLMTQRLCKPGFSGGSFHQGDMCCFGDISYLC